MRRPISLPSGSTAGGNERLLNVYAEVTNPKARNPYTLKATPGTTPFCYLPTVPVLALHEMGGVLYAVTASKFYSIDSIGAYTEIGDVNVSAPVGITDNGLDILIAGGSIYSYTPSGTLEQKTGSGWYSSHGVDYLDGYFILTRESPDLRGQFYITDIYDTTLDPLNYATAESNPDGLTAPVVDNRELLLFGTETIEPWYNSGDPDFTFERSPYIIQSGSKHADTIQKMDNTVYWLGTDRMVYRIAGHQAQRVSNHKLEEVLSGDLTGAWAWVYEEQGHTFYVLTIPAESTTWAYDVAIQEWHERGHYVHGHHHARSYAYAYGHHMVGDYQSGDIYMLEGDTDNGDLIVRDMVFPDVHANDRLVKAGALSLDMQAGIDATALLRWADSQSPAEPIWSAWVEASVGATGEYDTRVEWRRLGQFRRRAFNVRITDPAFLAVRAAFLEGK